MIYDFIVSPMLTSTGGGIYHILKMPHAKSSRELRVNGRRKFEVGPEWIRNQIVYEDGDWPLQFIQ